MITLKTDPNFVHHLYGQGVNPLRIGTRTMSVEPIPAVFPQERLGHLATGGVSLLCQPGLLRKISILGSLYEQC